MQHNKIRSVIKNGPTRYELICLRCYLNENVRLNYCFADFRLDYLARDELLNALYVIA